VIYNLIFLKAQRTDAENIVPCSWPTVNVPCSFVTRHCLV